MQAPRIEKRLSCFGGERGERRPLAHAGARAEAIPVPRRSAATAGRSASKLTTPPCWPRSDATATPRSKKCAAILRRGALRASASARSSVSLRATTSRAKKDRARLRAKPPRRRGAAREEWFEGQLDLEPERLIFIDETWASTNMARRYGRAPRGQRLRVGVPFGHWKTTTFVGALTLRGFIAPFVIDGPIDRLAFETYVEKVLLPELHEGDVVIMDNLPGHKGPRVRDLIEVAGASLLYLPPYSPDFNPIENAFAKLKALLRKAAERTVEGLWKAIGQLIDLVTPHEIQNMFAAAGYDA